MSGVPGGCFDSPRVLIMRELAILTGIPASGKSSFCRGDFLAGYARISLDALRTRKREARCFLEYLKSGRDCVIDNTNVTRAERRRYIEGARKWGYRIVGFYFESNLEKALQDNEGPGRVRVPAVAIRDKIKKMEFPEIGEGFDALFRVRSAGDSFEVMSWETC